MNLIRYLNASSASKNGGKGEEMKKILTVLVIGLFLLSMFGIAQASTLFGEQFNSDLSAWTGKSGGTHHGQIVNDPLNSQNRVLNFTALGSAGDIFSASTFLSLTSGQYILSFDYLGLDSGHGINGNLGGTIGYSYGLPGNHVWLAGTTLSGGIQKDLLVKEEKNVPSVK